MLTSLSNELPRAAGFKYIDIWLLFCLLIPVMEILLHTVEDHFNRRYSQVRGRRGKGQHYSNNVK